MRTLKVSIDRTGVIIPVWKLSQEINYKLIPSVFFFLINCISFDSNFLSFIIYPSFTIPLLHLASKE